MFSLFIFNDFLMSLWKILLKICWCNFSSLVFIPMDPDPDPYGHFWDPESRLHKTYADPKHWKKTNQKQQKTPATVNTGPSLFCQKKLISNQHFSLNNFSRIKKTISITKQTLTSSCWNFVISFSFSVAQTIPFLRAYTAISFTFSLGTGNCSHHLYIRSKGVRVRSILDRIRIRLLKLMQTGTRSYLR